MEEKVIVEAQTPSHLEIEHRLTSLETRWWIIVSLLLGNFGIGILNLLTHVK